MGTEFDQAVVQEDNTTIIDDEQQQEENSNVLTSLSTAVTRAVFIGSCTTTKPLLQEQISKDDPLLLWESNDQVVDCRRCHRYFNFIVRRHHCRKCGQIICDKCSTQRVYLPPLHIIIPPHQQQQQLQDLNQLSLKPQRICDQCVVHVNNEDLVTKKKRSASIMTECPVCAKKLTEYDTVKEQEHHVQECFNNGSSPIGIRFVVYKLTSNSALIGQECVICFEEFNCLDTVTRLNCMCSYHGHCINTWFSKGKECPIHSQ
ncbi:FYVE zinc finger-domain-containing protein [Helicostylum pulchrum]|nr:FYVE zinc finger-domain-containing protein [Helicostylum pulchrum]